jgi:hypothetical protein
MRAKIRLAVAAAVALFGVAVAFLPKPAEAVPCAKVDCYEVTVDYEGTGPATCCHYLCPSGDSWVCHSHT